MAHVIMSSIYFGHIQTFPSFSHIITGGVDNPAPDNAVWHSVSFMKNYTLLYLNYI